jgi:uncharacterized protein
LAISRLFSEFDHKEYLNLETYRKDGRSVRTPVWFLFHNDSFYIRTLANTGKVKRIRRNTTVKFAPCNEKGEPTGEWLSGQASIAGAQPSLEIDGLLTKKYGFRKRVFDLIVKIQRKKWIILQILPVVND